MICLENDQVLIAISGTGGWVNRLFDKRKQLEYIVPGYQADPFRIELESGISSDFLYFTCKYDESVPGRQGLALIWEVADGITIIGHMYLEDDANEIMFYCESLNRTEERIISLEYPILPNIHTITEHGEFDYLVHSFTTGFQIHNPMKHFETNGLGFRHMPYPEGFSGATMQFFAYYGLHKGGLYFAAMDGEGYTKWLNFYKNGNGLLEASFIHACEDIGPGKGIKTEYPVLFKLLEGHDWHEAADIYKQWAEQQFWCGKGKLTEVQDQDKCGWLLEQTGAATFGVNAGYDRTLWLNKYHEYITTPMFHILGPDWTHKTQNFYNGVPGGLDDWFPTRLNQANLQCFETYEDKYAPFEFDYLFNVNGADGELGRKALQKFPEESLKSIDKYKFSLVCPADPYIRDLQSSLWKQAQPITGM